MALIRTPAGCGLGDLSEVVADPTVREDVKDKFGPLLDVYSRYLEIPTWWLTYEHYDCPRRDQDWLDTQSLPMFTPDEIMRLPDLLAGIALNHPEFNKPYGRTGLFLTQLIQYSHDKGGYDSFTLDVRRTPILEKIGFQLNGHARAINVRILGDAGKFTFFAAQNLGTIRMQQVDTASLELMRDVRNVLFEYGPVGIFKNSMEIGKVYVTDAECARQINHYRLINQCVPYSISVVHNLDEVLA